MTMGGQERRGICGTERLQNFRAALTEAYVGLCVSVS